MWEGLQSLPGELYCTWELDPAEEQFHGHLSWLSSSASGNLCISWHHGLQIIVVELPGQHFGTKCNSLLRAILQRPNELGHALSKVQLGKESPSWYLEFDRLVPSAGSFHSSCEDWPCQQGCQQNLQQQCLVDFQHSRLHWIDFSSGGGIGSNIVRLSRLRTMLQVHSGNLFSIKWFDQVDEATTSARSQASKELCLSRANLRLETSIPHL